MNNYLLVDKKVKSDRIILVVGSYEPILLLGKSGEKFARKIAKNAGFNELHKKGAITVGEQGSLAKREYIFKK